MSNVRKYMPKPTRKIIQIATYRTEELDRGFVVALCDDGTTWELCPLRGVWRELPEIPQPGGAKANDY